MNSLNHSRYWSMKTPDHWSGPWPCVFRTVYLQSYVFNGYNHDPIDCGRWCHLCNTAYSVSHWTKQFVTLCDISAHYFWTAIHWAPRCLLIRILASKFNFVNNFFLSNSSHFVKWFHPSWTDSWVTRITTLWWILQASLTTLDIYPGNISLHCSYFKSYENLCRAQGSVSFEDAF